MDLECLVLANLTRGHHVHQSKLTWSCGGTVSEKSSRSNGSSWPKTICTRNTGNAGRSGKFDLNPKCGLDIFGRCQWKRGGELGIWQTIGKLNDREHQSEATETDSIGHKGIHGEK